MILTNEKTFFSVGYDITPFRPKTIQMKLFFMKCAGSQIVIIEVSLRTKKKTFQKKNRQKEDLSNSLINVKTKIRHYKSDL